MMRGLIVLSLAVLLVACTTVSKFTKEGAVEAQQRKDEYECERDTSMIPGAAGSSYWIQMYEKCMQVRGYKPVPGTGGTRLF